MPAEVLAAYQPAVDRLKAQFPDLEWAAPPDASGVPILVVPAEELPAVVRFMKEDPALDCDYLTLITGVDMKDHLRSVYHLYSFQHRHTVGLRVNVDRDQPAIPSIADLHPTADWMEREAYDLVGINYSGHPNLCRILMPDDWVGFPLRKDYVSPKDMFEDHALREEMGPPP